MATKKPSLKSTATAATPTARTTPPANLATAKTADGAIHNKNATSVYEICGIRTHSYRTNSHEVYSRDLASMNLLQLQDEAFERGIMPSGSREAIIDRLERKFIQDCGKFRTNPSERVDGRVQDKDTQRDEVLRILSRGR